MSGDPIQAIPRPADRRMAVRVTRDALRQIRGGHPWVYGDSIESTSHNGAPGDLAVVFDDSRRFAAIGLWDPNSPISLRVLHSGNPTPIDEGFWRQALLTAMKRRQALEMSDDTTGYRVVHGENDGLPSLVIDRYGPVVVMKLYSEAWLPHLRTLVPLVDELLGPGSIVLRLARNVEARESFGLSDGDRVLGKPLHDSSRYLENGLEFEAHPSTGQKTGAFLDQRENRALVLDRAEGCDVLDVFSYAGGFSVHAAAGGARSVHSVDQSPKAIATVSKHLALNASAHPQITQADQTTTVGDAFEVMADLAAHRRQFGLVVIDPPSFAQRQSSIPGALRAYRRLTELGFRLTAPGGLLFQCSCSSRVSAEQFYATVHHVAEETRTTLTEIELTGHPSDHPIGFPQGGYLKALLARVDH